MSLYEKAWAPTLVKNYADFKKLLVKLLGRMALNRHHMQALVYSDKIRKLFSSAVMLTYSMHMMWLYIAQSVRTVLIVMAPS